MTTEINHPDMTVEEMAENRRWFITFKAPTKNNEQLVVELTRCDADPKDKNAFPYIAYKNGWTDRLIAEWWNVQTYATDADGICWGERYNPTVKYEEYETYEGKKPVMRKRLTRDFDWFFEATEDNARKLLEEIERRAFAQTIIAALIPCDEQPRLITLTQVDGSYLKPLQELVGGFIEAFDVPYGEAPLLWVNDDGIFSKKPNRAVYANQRMVDYGFLSQIDGHTPVVLGQLYTILYGDIVAVSYDRNEKGEDVARDITDEEFNRLCLDFSDHTTGLGASLAVRAGLA